MPKQQKRKFHQYSEESMQNALEAVKNGAKIRKTCRNYGIPRATLQDRLQGRVNNKARRMGPDPYLSVENEKKVVDWLINLAKCGFPIKKYELISTVQKIVLDGKIKTPFKEGRPGQKWYLSFMRRHPMVSMRIPESIDKSRAKLTEEYIKSWFRELEVFLESIGASDILTYPSRMFNADESGFSLCPKSGKVLGPRGYKNLFEVKKGMEKDNITVLVTFSADGKLCPPCVVYPYVRPPRAIAESMPPDWILGKSDSGWMRSEVFYEYVANGLNKWILSHNIEKPVLFFVDGHRSHMSIELSKFCDDNSIIVYALPPNATHLMQPADVAVFKPLKVYWQKAVRNWQNENPEKTLSKADFAPVFKEALFNSKIPEIIRQGFKRCGLFPYDPQAVDYSKCVQNTLEKNIQPDILEGEQVEELSFSDFQSTHKVLNSLKSNLVEKVGDVNWLLKELQVFEEKVLGVKQITVEDDLSKNITRTENATVSEYEINADGSLTLVKPNEVEPMMQVNPETIDSKVKISRIDIVYPKTHSNKNNVGKDFIAEIEIARNETESQLLINKDTYNEFNIDVNRDVNGLNLEEQKLTCEVQIHQENVVQLDTIYRKDVVKENCELDNILETRSDKISDSDINLTEETLPVDEITTNCFNVKESENSDNTIDYFKEHLKYPKLLPKSKRTKSGPSTSAICSEAWRNYFIDKDKEKEEKENMKKRRREESERRKTEKSSKNMKKQKNKEKAELSQEVEVVRKKQKCGVCDDELDSDAEEEGEKNVGCDMCPKWFHLNCTKLSGHAYDDVRDQDFYCDFCCDD